MNSYFPISILLGAIVLFGVSSCVQNTTESNSLNVNDEEAIKSTMTDMWKAIEEKDIKKYASYIHPDFTQFGENDPTLNIGKAEEIQNIRGWLESASNVHTVMEKPMVTIRGEVAWITYYWRDRGNYGEESFSSRGKSTRIFVKENGKWLCIHGHYTLLEEE